MIDGPLVCVCVCLWGGLTFEPIPARGSEPTRAPDKDLPVSPGCRPSQSGALPSGAALVTPCCVEQPELHALGWKGLSLAPVTPQPLPLSHPNLSLTHKHTHTHTHKNICLK